MTNRAPNPPAARGDLPRPTLQYRLRAWQVFQRALDPLAAPKPLRSVPGGPQPLEGGCAAEKLEALEEPR